MQKRSSPSPPPRRTKQQSRLRAGAVENPRIVELMATWPPELPWLGVVELSERVTDLHRPTCTLVLIPVVVPRFRPNLCADRGSARRPGGARAAFESSRAPAV